MKRKALLSAVAATLLSVYGCNTTPDVLPFDPAKMQQNTRDASRELPDRDLKPLPTTLDTTYVPKAGGKAGNGASTQPALSNGVPLRDDPIQRMTLPEAVLRAVNNNWDIRVAGYEPGVNSNRVVEAESKFDPTFFANPFYEYRNLGVNYPNYSFTTPSPTDVWSLSTGIRQDLQSGGTAEIRWEPSQYWVSKPELFGGDQKDFWSNNLVAELKQPLLKNFGADVNTARITIARNDQRISLLDYRKKLEEVLFKVEQTYWQLVNAEQEVRISEELLQRTIDTAVLLSKRGAEDVTRIQTSQATSAIELRRATLIRSRANVRNFSDQLKTLMNDPELPVSTNVLILPATDPITTAVKFDWQDQINQALEHRLDLAQQILRVESQSTIVKVAKNNILPALSFVQTITANNGEVAFDDTLYNMSDLGHVSYRGGFQFEIPIGNRQAEAIYQRTLLQRQQTIDQYRAIVDQASLEVKTALRDVQTTWEEMASNHAAVLATADTLDRINARMRESEEAYTPSFVQLRLDTQARLAEAQRSESQAISNYAVAIATLERAKGTLLRYDNVLMEEDRLTATARGRVLGKVPPLAPVPTTMPAN